MICTLLLLLRTLTLSLVSFALFAPLRFHFFFLCLVQSSKLGQHGGDVFDA